MPLEHQRKKGGAATRKKAKRKSTGVRPVTHKATPFVASVSALELGCRSVVWTLRVQLNERRVVMGGARGMRFDAERCAGPCAALARSA